MLVREFFCAVGLLHPTYGLHKGQAGKLIFFAPCFHADMVMFLCISPMQKDNP